MERCDGHMGAGCAISTSPGTNASENLVGPVRKFV